MKTNVIKIGKIIKSTLVVSVLCLSMTSFGQTQKEYAHEIEIHYPLAIEDHSSSQVNELSNIIVYSANKECHLKFNKPANENVIINIYDMSGKQVHSDVASSSISNFEKTYNFSNFSDGVYVVNLYSSNKIISRKFFI